MKIKDIYESSAEEVIWLDASTLLPEWFPEIPGLGALYDAEGFSRLMHDARIAVKVHAREFLNGMGRYAQVASLWWEGSPVALMLTAGEYERVSYNRRIVTSLFRLQDLLCYLRRVFERPVPAAELASADDDFHPDELLEFGGAYFTKELGQVPVPVQQGWLLWAGGGFGHELLESQRWLIVPAGTQPPRYVRQCARHFEVVRAVPPEKWTGSSMQRFTSHDGDKDAYEYIACKRPPADQAVVRLV